MKTFAILLLLYPVAGGVAGFLVAAFAVWPVEFAERFPYTPIKTELSFIYGATIGFPFGAIAGFLYGLTMYWIMKPLSQLLVVVTLCSSVSVIGIVGALSHPVQGIRGSLLGLAIGTTFLLAIRPNKIK